MPGVLASQEVRESTRGVHRHPDKAPFCETAGVLFPTLDELLIDPIFGDDLCESAGGRHYEIDVPCRPLFMAHVADRGFAERSDLKLRAVARAPRQRLQPASPIRTSRAEFDSPGLRIVL